MYMQHILRMFTSVQDVHIMKTINHRKKTSVVNYKSCEDPENFPMFEWCEHAFFKFGKQSLVKNQPSVKSGCFPLIFTEVDPTGPQGAQLGHRTDQARWMPSSKAAWGQQILDSNRRNVERSADFPNIEYVFYSFGDWIMKSNCNYIVLGKHE